jgi:predicted dehydrogenase
MFANRRDFLKGAISAPAVRTAWGQQGEPSDRVNVAVVGIHGKGREHYQNYAIIPNTRVSVLCDVDERLFPAAVAETERLQKHRPQTETDIRKVLERKDVDAVSLAVPDYWHALMTIWACQAGKDVYVEKPVSFTVVEGRKMVEAARKYKRIVQAGQNIRSEFAVQNAMKLLRSGGFGKPYRARVNFARPRASIGRVKDSPVPPGVNWDLYRGPAPMVPFNYNRFHYGWHFFWDTGGTTEVGMNGVHYLDLARWGLGKDDHPVRIHCAGGNYIWDSDQETPTYQTGTCEYPDGSIIDFDVTTLYVPRSGDPVNSFYTSKGYVVSEGRGWKAIRGEFTPRKTGAANEEMALSERAGDASFPEASYMPGPEIPYDRAKDSKGHYLHWANFVACVRSRRTEDLACDILEGHRSAAICHLANISFRLGRKLVFNPQTEKFVGDPEADSMLTRQYRKPYVLPGKV